MSLQPTIPLAAVADSNPPLSLNSERDPGFRFPTLGVEFTDMSRKRAVTLKDLAAQLDLGITTVSDILLRGKTNYRAETVERVKAAAAKIGYRPNALAQGIRRGKTQTIGLVVTFNILDPFFAELVNRLEERFEQAGFMVILSISENNPQKDRKALDFLESRRVDGLVIGPVYVTPAAPDPSAIYTARAPVVMFLAPGDSPNDTVNLAGEHRALGRRVARHFLDHGHTRIGYHMCHPDPNKVAGDQAYRGFYETLHEHGLYNEDWVWIEQRSLAEVSYARMKRELAARNRSDLPTAFFCHNDHCAIGALAAIREAGYLVPKDFSLISVDNITASAFCDPPLTTLDLKPAEIADQTFDLLMARLRDPRRPVQRRYVQPEFVERASVRTLR
ncbi:MAG: LacI family DNA-binding transcriptional regulator [Burkholderiales bacterium]|nr:LacI family DNA-binding transcriptional regulator [Opitutaceae bacterium]